MALDLRLTTGSSLYGKQPVKRTCPWHNDVVDSLLVYPDHLYCAGCHKFVRQQAGLALLLGYWDGLPNTELAAVRAVKHRIPEFDDSLVRVPEPKKIEPLDEFAPMAFHRYMLNYQKERMQKELIERRGFGERTIVDFVLGHTGSHFAVPIYSGIDGRRGSLFAIRFRVDPAYSADPAKYSGIYGYNETQIYPLWTLPRSIKTLWIVEGEFDAIAVRQAGGVSATLTNGAGRLESLPQFLLLAGVVVERWIVACDADDAGERAAHSLRHILNGTSRRARWELHKDIGALLAAGATLADIRLD